MRWLGSRCVGSAVHVDPHSSNEEVLELGSPIHPGRANRRGPGSVRDPAKLHCAPATPDKERSKTNCTGHPLSRILNIRKDRLREFWPILCGYTDHLLIAHCQSNRLIAAEVQLFDRGLPSIRTRLEIRSGRMFMVRSKSAPSEIGLCCLTILCAKQRILGSSYEESN